MTKKHITWMIILILLQGMAQASLGVSPASLEYGKVLRAEESQKTFQVYNTGAKDLEIDVYTKGECVDWFEFRAEDVVPAGGGINVVSRLKTSEDTASGTYRCTIYIQPRGNNTLEGEFIMGLSGGAATIAKFDVTGEQILAGTVSDIDVWDAEEGNPVEFKTKYENTGNVRSRPQITIKIKKNAKTVDEIEEKINTVVPGESREIEIKWETEGRELGSYTAEAEVSLEEETLKKQSLEFQVLEKGTFKKQGRITTENLKRQKEIGLGEMIEIEVEFQNTGQLDVTAAIDARVFYEEKLINTLQGSESLVEVNQTQTLTAYYKPEEAGRYRIIGEVVYDGKRISFGTIEYLVREKQEENQMALLVIPALIAAALGLNYALRGRMLK